MLTARQLDHLDRWGYPYVMEDFRFHMTLTGRLAADRRKAIMAMLQERFALLDLGSLSIDRIALFRQNNADSNFRIVGHWKLREGYQAVRIEPKPLPADPH
jgi:2'-5' RNA ligase